MNNKYVQQLLKSLFFISALIIVCAFLIRVLTDSETLSDYAAKNPELAYGDSSSHIDDDEEINEEDTDMEVNNKNMSNESNIEDTEAAQTEADEKNVANKPSTDRIVYKEGFYYESLNEEIKEKITGISYPVSESDAAKLDVEVFNTLTDEEVPAVSYDDLCYLSVLYHDFNGEVQTGELICNKGIANDLAEIFYELYLNEYQIEKIRLVDEYNADDTASITDNNTSCFNYRVVDGTTTLSKHHLFGYVHRFSWRNRRGFSTDSFPDGGGWF